MKEYEKQTTVFCCPHHGVLQDSVEYTTANLGSKRMVDIPVMYCSKCDEYYTPFTNLLALLNIEYKGKKVLASKGRVDKSIPRIEVRIPHYVDAVEQPVISKKSELVRSIPDMANLSQQEIEYICQQISPKAIRSYFQKYPKEFARIRTGFRPNSLTDEDAIKLMSHNSDRPFVWSFIVKTVQMWLSEIEDYRKKKEEEGYSKEEALILAVPQSFFAGNIELYLKLCQEGCSEKYIDLFRSAVSLLKKHSVDRTTTDTGATTQVQPGEVDELTQKISLLQTSLDAEKTEHIIAAQALKDATAQNKVLQQNLSAAQTQIDAAKVKMDQMQKELEVSHRLTQYEDSDSEEVSNSEYEYTSICQVYSDHYTGQIWLTRLADIHSGKVSCFVRIDDQPYYFQNRDRLFWRDGPSDEGYIGIWNWNAVPNKSDPSTDYVTTSFNTHGKIIEIIELSDCRIYEDIAAYLSEKGIAYTPGRKYFFTLGKIRGEIPGLLCGENDFDISNGIARLKPTICVLPQFVISPTDIIPVANTKFYRFTSMGTPEDIYHVRHPLSVVKDIVLARATSAVLRQQGLSKKEAQHCQGFLRDLPVTTIVEDISAAYGCSEMEATEYFTDFCTSAESYLNETDLDVGTLSAALSRTPDIVKKCKQLLEDEWRSENETLLTAAKQERDCVAEEKSKLDFKIQTLKGEIQGYISEVEEIKHRIDEKTKIATDVEIKVAERIAAARENVADFICEMAFATGHGTPIPMKREITPLNVTRHKIACQDSDCIEDIDTFEEELACNFHVLGYKAAVANQMAQVVTYCICNNMPILCGSNAREISNAISATMYSKGACEITIPISGDKCTTLCELLSDECAEENAVVLLNGVFDSYSLNNYSTVMQYISGWNNRSVLVFSITGIEVASIPVAVWDKAWYIDGDAGLTQFPHGQFNGFSTVCDLSMKFEEAALKAERNKLKQFSAVLSNRAILNYAGYLTATSDDFKKSDWLLLQLLVQANAQNKTQEVLSVLEPLGIDVASNKLLCRYI